MKKLALLLAAVLLLSLAACGGKSNGGTVKPADDLKVKVYEETKGGEPAWVEEGDAIVMIDGVKHISFVGQGISKDKALAKDEAELAGSTNAALAIKRVATKQIAKAWEAIGAGENQTKEQVMKGLEAVSVKAQEIRGLRKAGTYYRYVSKPVDRGGKTEMGAPMYEYNMRFVLDYTTYERLRDGLVSQEKKEVKLNDRQKKLYADMEKELDKLDSSQEGKM